MLVDTIGVLLLLIASLNDNNGLWLLWLLQKLLFAAVQGLFVNSVISLLLLVVFEVMFGGLFHGVEAAEAEPEDDF